MRKQCYYFVLKNVIKILLFAMIASAATAAATSGVFNNQMALGQMQQNDELFVLLEVFRNVKQYVYIICGIGWVCLLYSVFTDAYKFAKTLNTNEQENAK